MTFRNDTKYPILIRTYARPGMVRFTLYSVPTGRRVSRSAGRGQELPARIHGRQVHARAEERPVGDDRVPGGRAGRLGDPRVKDRTGKVIHKETLYSHYAQMIGVILRGKCTPAGSTRRTPAVRPSADPAAMVRSALAPQPPRRHGRSPEGGPVTRPAVARARLGLEDADERARDRRLQARGDDPDRGGDRSSAGQGRHRGRGRGARRGTEPERLRRRHPWKRGLRRTLAGRGEAVRRTRGTGAGRAARLAVLERPDRRPAETRGGGDRRPPIRAVTARATIGSSRACWTRAGSASGSGRSSRSFGPRRATTGPGPRSRTGSPGIAATLKTPVVSSRRGAQPTGTGLSSSAIVPAQASMAPSRGSRRPAARCARGISRVIRSMKPIGLASDRRPRRTPPRHGDGRRHGTRRTRVARLPHGHRGPLASVVVGPDWAAAEEPDRPAGKLGAVAPHELVASFSQWKV